MKISKLNSQGLEQFQQYVCNLSTDGSLAPPMWLLGDSRYSTVVSNVEVEPQVFSSRKEAAAYLVSLFESVSIRLEEKDCGLWAWLTLFFFDQVCPAQSSGVRKPSKEIVRYIPAVNNFQKYYRHLLLGPYLIYRAHSQELPRVAAMLCGKLQTISDVVEQLASRQEIVSNVACLDVATRLYVDNNTNDYKRGAGGKGGGSPRRLSTIFDQFDLTYDIAGMSAEKIVELLPKEFDRFR